jgi:hypothetical protein
MAKQRHVDRVHHFLVIDATVNGTPRGVEATQTEADEIGFMGTRNSGLLPTP